MTTARLDPITLWQQIHAAGGVRAYIDGQLKERGFLVERRDVDAMSDREKEKYKKELKAEAAERKKLKKETWAAYRTAHIVNLGDGIWWNDEQTQDKWDTPNSEERASENELPPLDTPKQLAEALGLTIPQLRSLCYHRDAATKLHYVRFSIPKRDGTERPIWAPLPRLKQAQRWILHNIVERLPTHGSAHGFLVGRSTLSNAKVHSNSHIVVKMDIEQFFPTVTWRRVKGIFRRAGYREQMATLLALICTEAPREIVEYQGTKYFVSLGARCLPQGAPTSPALTNALCLRLDRRITALASKLGWRYTRYADDLTFSRSDDASPAPLIKLVTKIVLAEGFRVKGSKTRLHRSGAQQAVTGLIVNGDQTPRTPRIMRRELRAAIHNLERGKSLPEGETLARLQGYAAYVAMTDPKLGREMIAKLTTIAANTNSAS